MGQGRALGVTEKKNKQQLEVEDCTGTTPFPLANYSSLSKDPILIMHVQNVK